MNHLILYGAGQNAEDAYNRFAEEGRVPVCLCDGDPDKTGTIKQFCNGCLEILPLDEALKCYPDAEFYVTPNAPVKYEIMDMLTEDGVERLRIINCEPYMYVPACYYLQQYLLLSTAHVQFCVCTPYHDIKNPTASLDLSDEELFNVLSAMRNDAVDALKNNTEGGYCVGCPEAKMTYIPAGEASWKVGAIAFATAHICQLNCCYCVDKKSSVTENMPMQEKLHYARRALSFVRYLKEQGVVNNDSWILPMAGEISVHPLQSEILDLFNDNPCKILTNALVYSSDVEKILKKGKSFINVSLDSGTPGTYRRIKGGGDYNTVLSNIRNYGKHTKRIDLKYVLIPGINDGLADIDGFLDFAEEVGANVLLSRDSFGIADFENNAGDILRKAEYFRTGAGNRGIEYQLAGVYETIERHKGNVLKQNHTGEI